MNFLHLIKIDAKFRREMEQFFNISLKDYKYIGGNGFNSPSICYIFTDENNHFSITIINDGKIMMFSKYKNVYHSKVMNELYGIADLYSGKITVLYSKADNTTDVYFQKSNFSEIDDKKFTKKIVNADKLIIMEKLGGMEKWIFWVNRYGNFSLYCFGRSFFDKRILRKVEE